MDGTITLTTDFGWRDGYVGQMKGVILSVNSRARIVDICHDIEPQNVAQAAFVLGCAYRAFPAGTVHIAVVDPGVGTDRKAVLVEAGSQVFLAPDNGLLSYVLAENPGYRAFSLTDSTYWRKPVSRTFHGRDIFAPVGAHLSNGVAPGQFGEPVDSLVTLRLAQPERRGGELIGEVIHIDAFGNLVTNIGNADLPQGDIEVEIAGHIVGGLSRSYAEGGELLAIVGSSDRVEVARRNGNAARFLDARVGQQVILRTLDRR